MPVLFRDEELHGVRVMTAGRGNQAVVHLPHDRAAAGLAQLEDGEGTGHRCRHARIVVRILERGHGTPAARREQVPPFSPVDLRTLHLAAPVSFSRVN